MIVEVDISGVIIAYAIVIIPTVIMFSLGAICYLWDKHFGNL